MNEEKLLLVTPTKEYENQVILAIMKNPEENMKKKIQT